MLERRPHRLARYRPLLMAAPAALVGGIVGFWLDHALTGGGWTIPLAGAVAGGALTAVAETMAERIGGWVRRTAERAEERPPFTRLTPRSRDRQTPGSRKQLR
jgi:hypothetical protein